MVERRVLDELQDDARPLHCSPDVAAALETTGLVHVRPERGGVYRLSPCGKVGSVRIGDLQVDVHPKDKVPLGSVLFLLGYAKDPGFRNSDVAMSSDDDIFTAIAEALVRQAEYAVVRGLHRGYVSVDETTRTLRGRIRMGDQVRRHHGGTVPVEVTFDEYSADIPENQIVLTALRRLLGVPRLSADLHNRVLRVISVFAGVRELGPRQRLPQYHLSRLNQRYGPALALAELVLRHQSLAHTGDGLAGASFVVAMDSVYEDFVGKALSESLRRFQGRTVLQYRTQMDEASVGVAAVSMAVDVVHEVAGRPIIVADAKYKAESPSGRYANADKYQMLAYCTALEVDRAWLIYAAGSESVMRRVRNTGVEIIDWPLDLTGTPRAILARMDELVDAMVLGAGIAPVAVA